MTDTVDALAEPTRRVGVRFTGSLSLAMLGLWAGFFAPLQVLLPEQVAAIDPAAKVSGLALVTASGAAVALVVNPLAGALSDRTRSKLGRRRPWVLGSAVLGAVALVLLGVQSTVAGVAIVWCCAQLCLNTQLAALIAAVPDQVPSRQRGLVSGVVGLAQPLGVAVGVAVVSRIVTSPAVGYDVVAAVLLLTALGYVVAVREPPLSRAPASDGFWVSPRRYPDFAWAWVSRLLVNLSQALGIGYLIYFLQDVVRLPRDQAAQGVALLVAVYTGALLLTVVAAGWLSDRLRRRKIFVVASAAVIAVGTGLIAAWPTWTAAVIAAAVQGLGFGVYVAVDVALITQVLPTTAGRAKDLGILNIANTLPQLIGPVIAATLITQAGGYRGLFAGAAVLTLVGGTLVTRIRSVA
ncbi:MAG TPA: MFS transporter [Pseudonocardiaceae bacterium]|nr:MFS transporter [Pseudonocardiaceae bacterium]